MISATLTQIEKDLRVAAARRTFAEVDRMVVRVGAAAAAEIEALPAGDPHRREIALWLRDLFDWTGVMLRAARAAKAAELRQLPFVKSYLQQQTLSNL